jgi:hypothetical protein
MSKFSRLMRQASCVGTTIILQLLHISTYAQSDSIGYVYADAIEQSVAANDDNDFDYDTEFEHLKDFIRHPININKAAKTDFEQLKLLTLDQINLILEHRDKQGNYIALLELQSVLDLETIHRILPFVTCDGAIDDFQIDTKDWFKKGKNEAFLRWERRLETAKGYLKPNTVANPANGGEGGYLGGKDKLYMRYRYSFGTRLSYGFTLEKDAGEAFGKSVFDFWSIHFKINPKHKVLKTILLGDYSVALGQGLIHDNGFNLGKSALVLSIEKNNPPLRHYSSSNEANFMRGVALGLKMSQNTEGVIFASYRQRDGNLTAAIDATNLDDTVVISTLQNSGLHRTRLDSADKNAVGLMTFGGRIARTYRKGTIGINTVFNQFDRKIEPQNEPYNLYSFKGKKLLNISTDFKFTFKNVHVFGETALSDNLGWSTSNGIIVGLDKKLSFSTLYRYFSLRYQSINAQPFIESSRANDEQGLYMGFEYKPNRRWTTLFYADMWQHNWLKFRADAPSNGKEFFTKIQYKTKNTEGYIQVRTKTKEQNTTRPDTAKTNTLTPKTRTHIRLHFAYRVSRNLELRNRIEFSFYKDDEGTSKGFMAYQDVIYEFENRPLSISSRLAFFDTKDYQSAIYAYENDLINNFTILPYYYRGSRFYLNLSYKGFKNLLIEARLARTILTNRNTIGSGLEEIEGGSRTDVKVQLRWTL